jgi:tetratricopeptide (TPR) repeat protein
VKENSKRRILIVNAIAIVVVILVVAAIIVNGSGNQNNLRDQLDLAEQYLSDLDYEQAITAYEQALEIDPKCEEAYLALADIYVTLEDYDKALEILNEGYEQTGADSIVEKIEEIQNLLAEQEKAKEVSEAETEQESNVSSQKNEETVNQKASLAGDKDSPDPAAESTPADSQDSEGAGTEPTAAGEPTAALKTGEDEETGHTHDGSSLKLDLSSVGDSVSVVCTAQDSDKESPCDYVYGTIKLSYDGAVTTVEKSETIPTTVTVENLEGKEIFYYQAEDANCNTPIRIHELQDGNSYFQAVKLDVSIKDTEDKVTLIAKTATFTQKSTT